MPKINRVFIPVLLCWLNLGSVAQAHPVPDGVVFRGIQVVVWSDRIEVRYQLGLSDNMVRQELQQLSPADMPLPDDANQTIRLYGDRMFPLLPQKMSVTIDGRAQTLALRRIVIVRQPHVQIELVYRIDFAVSATPNRLVLVDDNFTALPGYHLAAIKGRGEVRILDSNAVEVLSRLSRVPEGHAELAALTVPMRRVEAMIAAHVAESLRDSEPAHVAESLRDSEPAHVAESLRDSERVAEIRDHVAQSQESGQPAPTARLLWPLWGGMLILAATLWMFAIVRRS